MGSTKFGILKIRKTNPSLVRFLKMLGRGEAFGLAGDCWPGCSVCWEPDPANIAGPESPLNFDPGNSIFAVQKLQLQICIPFTVISFQQHSKQCF